MYLVGTIKPIPKINTDWCTQIEKSVLHYGHNNFLSFIKNFTEIYLLPQIFAEITFYPESKNTEAVSLQTFFCRLNK